jgi:hypothetical protein
MSEIITEFVNPPIPNCGLRWCAYRDPEGVYGWGHTEQDAISDLLECEEA